MEILVICGAGASSTFVATRLARAAASAGLHWCITAGTEHTAEEAVGVDAILIGAHLADRADAVRAAHGGVVPTAVLPEDAFSDLDGSRTLRFVRDALPASLVSKGTP